MSHGWIKMGDLGDVSRVNIIALVIDVENRTPLIAECTFNVTLLSN